jgi:hypothetical protein
MNNYILSLDGEAIKIQNPLITLDQQLLDEDQSGQSSSTTASEQGQKAKNLNVSGVIKYSDQANLTRLFELATQRTESGQKKVYRIANSTAQAVKFRQGVFSGKVSASQNDKFMAWNVSFTLTERFSVPEKREANEIKPQKPLVIDDEIKDEDQELSAFEENFLKPADEILS